MSNQSWKVEGIRLAQQDARPDLAATQAVDTFERLAIRVPKALEPPADAKPWLARQYDDAAELYRRIAVTGDDGILLRDLATTKREAEATRLLRKSGAVSETKRAMADAAGRDRDLIALKVTETHEGEES